MKRFALHIQRHKSAPYSNLAFTHGHIKTCHTDCSSFAINHYPIFGRAEAIHYAAAIAGIAFEDRFITHEQHKKHKTIR